MDDETELGLEILATVKEARLGTITEEAATELIMSIVRDGHHCASCDMHACEDLDRAQAKLADDLASLLDVDAGLREITGDSHE
jgi:hypothetical protein